MIWSMIWAPAIVLVPAMIDAELQQRKKLTLLQAITLPIRQRVALNSLRVR